MTISNEKQDQAALLQYPHATRVKWTHPISWSNYRTLVSCPYRFELYLRKVPFIKQSPTYFAVLGTIVQRVFELFFLQSCHTRHKSEHWNNARAIMKDLLKSQWFKKLKLTYPNNKDLKIFVTEAGGIVKKSLEVWNDTHDLSTLRIQSEVDLRVNYRNLRMRGIVDFIIRTEDSKLLMYDGKVNMRTNADPEQLLFYAFLMLMGGEAPQQIAFFYWRHGIKVIEDFDSGTIDTFRESRIDPLLPLFTELTTTGVQNLPAIPSSNNCKYCDYNAKCPFSFYKAQTQPGMGRMEELLF